jgi:hypothetical protein
MRRNPKNLQFAASPGTDHWAPTQFSFAYRNQIRADRQYRVTIEFDWNIRERCRLTISEFDNQAVEPSFSSGRMTAQQLSAAVRLLPLVERITSHDEALRGAGRVLYRGWCSPIDVNGIDSRKHRPQIRSMSSSVPRRLTGELTTRIGPDQAA